MPGTSLLRRRPAALLWLILSIAFVLRIILVVRGGQFYWSDERLYLTSRIATDLFVAGETGLSMRAVLGAEHLLFKVIGLIPAFAEQVVGGTSRLPGVFFALFSVASIWIVWRIALRLGGTELEALGAAFLLACSSTWSYYSRHLLPYDPAMAIALVALLIALRQPSRHLDSWLCGGLSCAAFLCYSGYWALDAFVMLTRITWRSGGVRESISRGWRVALAFAIPPVAILGSNALLAGDMTQQLIGFSKTINQGAFEEGWSLPFAYFWHAEHVLSLVWLAALVCGLQGAIAGRRESKVPLAGVLFIYSALVVTSVGFHVFVVYGRVARQLVPFLCLLTAQQIHRLVRDGVLPRRSVAALAVVLICQAVLNMRTPMAQVFPDKFRERARQIAAAHPERPLQFLFAEHIFPAPEPVPAINGTVIAREAHPLQYFPYQYEGFTPEARALLRSTDISMRVVLPAQ